LFVELKLQAYSFSTRPKAEVSTLKHTCLSLGVLLC